MNNNFLPYQLKKNSEQANNLATQLAQKATKLKGRVSLLDYYNGTDTTYTNAFASAFNYLTSIGGGIVEVPLGIFPATIDLPSYCGIEGQGAKTIIQLPSNSTRACIQFADANNTILTYLSNFTIDGNKANQTSTNTHGIYLTGDQTDSYAHADYFGYRGNTITIQNVFINKCHGKGFYSTCAGAVYTDWLNIDGCDDDGFYTTSADSHFNNVSSGENYGHGLNIQTSNSRFVNCKGWNNGLNNTAQSAGYGFYLYGAYNVYIQGESQGNLLDGIYMSQCELCVVDIFADANGQNSGITATNGVNGFTLYNCTFNTIRGNVRNRTDRNQISQKYCVGLLGTTTHNSIDLFGLSMATGAVYDSGNNILYNFIKCQANDTNNNSLDTTTLMKTTNIPLSSYTTWGALIGAIPLGSVVSVQPSALNSALLPSGYGNGYGTIQINYPSGGRFSATLISWDGTNSAPIINQGVWNNATGTMVWTRITAREGTFTTNGSGQTSVTIPHGLGVVPTYVHAQSGSADAGTGIVNYVTADATNITVYFKNALTTGTNNIVLYWRAKP